MRVRSAHAGVKLLLVRFCELVPQQEANNFKKARKDLLLSSAALLRRSAQAVIDRQLNPRPSEVKQTFQRGCSPPYD
jgi:hypothetical protein